MAQRRIRGGRAMSKVASGARVARTVRAVEGGYKCQTLSSSQLLSAGGDGRAGRPAKYPHTLRALCCDMTRAHPAARPATLAAACVLAAALRRMKDSSFARAVSGVPAPAHVQDPMLLFLGLMPRVLGKGRGWGLAPAAITSPIHSALLLPSSSCRGDVWPCCHCCCCCCCCCMQDTSVRCSTCLLQQMETRRLTEAFRRSRSGKGRHHTGLTALD